MTTTPVPDSDSDPVMKLLKEILLRDDARAKSIEKLQAGLDKLEKESVKEMQASLDKLEHGNQQQKSYNERTTANFEELKGGLQRQDGQITALDQRIAGNYRGQAAQGDLILGEIKDATERLGNIERALVENHRHTKTLQGSLLEEGDRLGARVGQLESSFGSVAEVATHAKTAITGLSHRIEALESRTQEAAAAGG